MRERQPPDRVRAQRAAWQHRGQRRPSFAVEPAPDQESVWDYPRPPAIVADARLIEVHAGDRLLASSRDALRVLETASPPTFYLPRCDVDMTLLQRTARRSFCEWKGEASYYDLVSANGRVRDVAWSYEQPYAAFAVISGHLSFYPGRVACYLDGERVRAQPGGFYGGWITREIVGPFKGEPGTEGW